MYIDIYTLFSLSAAPLIQTYLQSANYTDINNATKKNFA